MKSCFLPAQVLLWSLPFLRNSECSLGDRSVRFQQCLFSKNHICREEVHVHLQYPAVLPVHLKFLGWSCMDELKYLCMHDVTHERLEADLPVLQYYGKWPFVRLYGIQEPASTLFSLANMAAHLLGWMKFSAAASHHYKFYNSSKLYLIVSVNAWIWSTVFHSRDLVFTERMDYFSATFLVLNSILFCFKRVVFEKCRVVFAKCIKVFRIIGDPQKPVCYIFGVMVIAVFSFHIYWMAFVRFDYGYNMKFNVGIGAINLVMWLTWCALGLTISSIQKRKERPYTWKCALINIATFTFLGLELFDFPPIWWTFDAHSLWHLSTVPLGYFWYSFLIDDQKFEIAQEIKKQKIL